MREGRDFISSTFENRIRALTEKSAPERSEKAVRVQDIRFRYARESADILRDVSLDVCRGEHLCLLGGNGTGKTTLLGILSGALKPYHGTVTLDGKSSARTVPKTYITKISRFCRRIRRPFF